VTTKTPIAKVKEMLRQWRENHAGRTCKGVPFVVVDQLAN
jgi:hypothetical protein